jgi:hypothetical protein
MRPPETPQELNIYELWRAVGVIVSLQITILGWRISREQRLSEKDRERAHQALQQFQPGQETSRPEQEEKQLPPHQSQKPTNNWFPIADYLNVLSIAISIIFVFVIPILTPLTPFLLKLRLGMLGVLVIIFVIWYCIHLSTDGGAAHTGQHSLPPW